MPRLAVLVYAASAFSDAAPCFLVDPGQLLGLMVSIFGADIMVFLSLALAPIHACGAKLSIFSRVRCGVAGRSILRCFIKVFFVITPPLSSCSA